MEPIYNLGIQLIQALQALDPAVEIAMKFYTFMGRIEFYLLVIPYVYWVVDVQLGFRALLLLISTDFFGMAFKQLLRQPRPYWIGDVEPMALETSYGIPSTHASDSVAVWGYLAYRLRKGWLWVIVCVVIFMIGVSRIYLGVHFPTDVLGGWLIGLIMIAVFVVGERILLPWLIEQSHTALIGIGFGVSIVIILVGQLILELSGSVPDPPVWAQFSTLARTPNSYYTLGGALFGAVAGFILMQDHARFQVKSAWWLRIASYLVGIVGVLFIYYGLDILFGFIAADENALGYLLRYTRYGCVTLWVTFGAPWVFIKARLVSLGS
jgi:membrane-associated phospholipid phosphatase